MRRAQALEESLQLVYAGGMSSNGTLTVTVLGSGTSAGVPMIGCHCAVCTSGDVRDKRSRPSIAVHYEGRSILVDTSPELRLQAVATGLDRIDAVVFTHAHADHIFGLDDVRRYNTIMGTPLPVYARRDAMTILHQAFGYAFANGKQEGVYRPELVAQEITGPFDLFGQPWTPIAMPHGPGEVLGFRVGDFAYCTDCSAIPPAAEEKLQNLDVLIIDALRPRPHVTHLSFAQALEIIERLQPRRAFFTHLSHDVRHVEIERDLPAHIRVCYDGLKIECESS